MNSEISNNFSNSIISDFQTHNFFELLFDNEIINELAN